MAQVSSSGTRALFWFCLKRKRMNQPMMTTQAQEARRGFPASVKTAKLFTNILTELMNRDHPAQISQKDGLRTQKCPENCYAEASKALGPLGRLLRGGQEPFGAQRHLSRGALLEKFVKKLGLNSSFSSSFGSSFGGVSRKLMSVQKCCWFRDKLRAMVCFD